MAHRHRRHEVERLLRKRERLGLTYRELSEESGIPVPTLAWWSRKLEGESEGTNERAERSELIAVEVVEDELDGRDVVIEIVIDGKLRVLVPSTASEGHLQRVLRAVASC